MTTPAYRSIATAQSTAQNGSLTCNKPSGTVAGDLLIACHGADWGTLAQMGTPTGGAAWSLLASIDSGTDSLHTKVWWKIAGPSEPTNYGFTQNAASLPVAIIVAIEGAAQTEPAYATTTGGSSTAITTPGVTPLGPDDLEIRVAVGVQNDVNATLTPPAGFTLRDQIQAGKFTIIGVATRVLSTGAPTSPANFVSSSSSFLTGQRHGLAIAVPGPLEGRPRPPTVSTAAVHRAASW